jgi:hypothetical protein
LKNDTTDSYFQYIWAHFNEQSNYRLIRASMRMQQALRS